jgi:hypothetical protein
VQHFSSSNSHVQTTRRGVIVLKTHKTRGFSSRCTVLVAVLETDKRLAHEDDDDVLLQL